MHCLDSEEDAYYILGCGNGALSVKQCRDLGTDFEEKKYNCTKEGEVSVCLKLNM